MKKIIKNEEFYLIVHEIIKKILKEQKEKKGDC